jgi:hypothetical protein
MALSPVQKIWRGQACCRNAVNQAAVGQGSPKERMLKDELKLAKRAEVVGANGLQVFHGLQEWIGMQTGARPLPAKQPAPNIGQAVAHPSQEVINRFQGERQAQFMRRRFDASVHQQLNQELAQQGCADRVAWQNIGQENRKRLSTTAATTAI